MSSLACIDAPPEFFFVHVQKTAGKSVSQSLLAINSHNRAATMHDSARTLRGWFPNKWRECPSFAFVRNPWDRWVSIYHHYPWARKFGTFNRFLRRRSEWLPGWSPAQQWAMICDADGKPIIQHVFRFETLRAGWDTLCGILGMRNRELLFVPETGREDRRHWRAFYDDETRRTVEKISSRDIALFRYTFDGGPP